jgi:murein DD-endopeptidase MepM/ murein hydrolase activator NlpD
MRRLVAAAIAALTFALAPDARAVELEGTWYVLVHFQDETTNNADAWRWDDRVWRFTRKGDRLEWTEHPIVQLDDDSGRFEAMRGGRAARVLGAWEPNPAQLADIQNGLSVNSRGEKTKTLRASAGGTSWSSGEGSAADSAMVITYSETWAIAGLPDAPVFTRDDSMGSASSESMEGRTEYRTDSVDASGNEIKGVFGRDGTRSGRFRLIRTEAAHGLTAAATSQQDLQRKAGARALASSGEMRQLIRERVQQEMVAAGTPPSEAELDKLTAAAIASATRSGSADEASASVAKQAEGLFYAFATRGAKHDDSVRYLLPFDPSVPRQLGQGVGGEGGVDLYGNVISNPGDNPASHVGRRKYGFDWELPKGTPVVAARDGTVARVVDGSTRGGPQQGTPANLVLIEHADGSYAEYVGLDIDVPVAQGQSVRAGDVIGSCGGTGGWRGGLGGLGIHFAVGRVDDKGEPETVDIRFDDGSQAGYVPTPGSYYGRGGAKAPTADLPKDGAKTSTE